MKTTIIPAQVTTVEDKIANNLNLTQLVLLVLPILIGIVVYGFLPRPFKIAAYKIPLILVPFIIFPTLSLRIKDRVLINWLVLLLSYMARPHIYIFNKNDTSFRDINFRQKKKSGIHSKNLKAKISKDKTNELDPNLIDYQAISRNKNVNFRMNKSRVLLSKEI